VDDLVGYLAGIGFIMCVVAVVMEEGVGDGRTD